MTPPEYEFRLVDLSGLRLQPAQLIPPPLCAPGFAAVVVADPATQLLLVPAELVRPQGIFEEFGYKR